jgi:hypothetical protein
VPPVLKQPPASRRLRSDPPASAHTVGSLGGLARTAAVAASGRGDLATDPKDRRFTDPAWARNLPYLGLCDIHLAAKAELAGTELS